MSDTEVKRGRGRPRKIEADGSVSKKIIKAPKPKRGVGRPKKTGFRGVHRYAVPASTTPVKPKKAAPKTPQKKGKNESKDYDNAEEEEQDSS